MEQVYPNSIGFSFVCSPSQQDVQHQQVAQPIEGHLPQSEEEIGHLPEIMTQHSTTGRADCGSTCANDSEEALHLPRVVTQTRNLQAGSP